MKMWKETQPGSRPGRFLPTGVLRHLNKVRHGVQVGVLLFVLTIPVLSLYQSYAASYAIQWMEGGEQLFWGNLDRIAFWLSDDPVEALDAVKGSVWSAKIGGLKISDPLAVAGQTVAEKRIYWPFVLSMLIPVLITLVLGRVFCGWVCPAYLLYEVGDVFRQLLNRAGIRPRNIRLPLATKYVVLGIGIAGGGLLGVALFPMIYPPAVIGREVYYAVYNGALGSGAVLLAISLFIEIGISRRAICRYLCPGGALYSLLGAGRVVRLRRDADACIPCIKCDDVCGLGLNPMTDRTGMECNNCTACIAVCPHNALTLAIGWNSGNFSSGAGTGTGSGTKTSAGTGSRDSAGRRGGSSSSQGAHDSHLPDRAAYTA